MSAMRKRSPSFNPFLAVLLIVVGVVGAIVTLHVTGRVEIAFLDRMFGNEVQAAEEQDPSLVAIIVSARTLAPGQRVELKDVWDTEKRAFKVARVHEDSVKDYWLRDWNDIEGRVLAKEKKPNKAFSESDFMPEGTREGIVSLVPPGMRLVPLEADKVTGLDQLAYEDRFDLIASVPVDKRLFDEAEQALERAGKGVVDTLRLAGMQKSSHERTLVRSGMLIAPAGEQAAGGSRGKKRVVSIVVSPAEVNTLLEAVNLGLDVHCIAHSGLPGRVAEELPDDADPLDQYKWLIDSMHEIEVIEGDASRKVVVPKN